MHGVRELTFNNDDISFLSPELLYIHENEEEFVDVIKNIP